MQDLIHQYWEKYHSETDIRTRHKHLKKAGYFAAWLARMEDVSLEQLQTSLTIMREEKQISPGEHLAKDLPRAIAKWLTMKGLDKPTIKFEIKGSIAVESGVIGIADPALAIQDGEDCMEAGLKTLAEQGRQISLSTGGDGRFGVKIRLIEGLEPILNIEEYKKLIFSQSGTLRIESGKLAVNDLWRLNQPDSISTNLPNGHYNTEAYYIENSSFCGVIVVLVRIQS